MNLFPSFSFYIFQGTSSILRYIKGPNSTVSPANLDCSSLPEDPSLGNKLYIAPNHEEHCEPSLSEKEDYGNNSNLAKQCQIKEEKKVSKKLTEVKVRCSFPLWIHETSSLWISYRVLNP
jgi:DNA polymerase eta